MMDMFIILKMLMIFQLYTCHKLISLYTLCHLFYVNYASKICFLKKSTKTKSHVIPAIEKITYICY